MFFSKHGGLGYMVPGFGARALTSCCSGIQLDFNECLRFGGSQGVACPMRDYHALHD